jgi:phage major tail protein, phi13 family
MKNNIVSFGLKNVHYAIATLAEDGHTWSYGTPVALKGAQEFTSDIIGGSTPVYADDQVITTLNQNAGRTITLKVTELPDEFKIDVLGFKKLENGNLIEVANAPVVTFALGLEFQGDVKARRMWFYLCTATPVSESTKSKTDSVEANATTITISARPIEVDEDTCITYVLSSKGDENYKTFLTTAPVLPILEKGEN